MEELKILEIPNKYFKVDERGNFNNNIVENKKLENASYWVSKSQQIGLLMLVSMGALVIMLIVETDIFNFLWGLLWGA